MTEQPRLFERKQSGKHTHLLRKRTKVEDYGRRIALVLKCFEPIDVRQGKEQRQNGQADSPKS